MDAKTAPMDNKTPTMDDKTPTMFGIYDLHPRLLLFAGTRAAILRAGLVELPREVEHYTIGTFCVLFYVRRVIFYFLAFQ